MGTVNKAITILAAVGATVLFLSPNLSAQSISTPRPSATATHTPEPTPIPPKTGKCCACVLAEEGTYTEAEERRFYDYCKLCLMDEQQNPKAVGCDSVFNTHASRFEMDLNIEKSRGECSKEIYVANNQHGPIFDTVAGLISVCVKTFPTCSIELEDHSCETFRNEKEVQVFLTSIQSGLGEGGSVNVCGNSSSNFATTCALLSARKRYVVSKYSLAEKAERCNPEGRVCSPIGDSWQCLDFGKKLITQKCCGEVGSLGYFGLWVNNADCRGAKECPERCRKDSFGLSVHHNSCVSPTKRRSLACVELAGGGYTCKDFTLQCELYEVCKDGACVSEFELPATPTPIATSTPTRSRPGRSSKTAASSSSVGPLSPVRGAPHHYTGSPATLSLAFTSQLFFGTSQTAQFGGAHGANGVALLKIDPVSTISMIGLTAGDVIHFVNEEPIETEADVIAALAQSRKRTFITFSRPAPKEQAESNSILPKPARWNWIVTIHAQDKAPSMDR